MAKSRDAKANKSARAEAKATRKAAAKQRRSQLWQAFNIQRQEDKRLLPYMIGAFVLIVAIAVAIGVWSGGFALITMPALGVALGALVAFIIFGIFFFHIRERFDTLDVHDIERFRGERQ